MDLRDRTSIKHSPPHASDTRALAELKKGLLNCIEQRRLIRNLEHLVLLRNGDPEGVVREDGGDRPALSCNAPKRKDLAEAVMSAPVGDPLLNGHQGETNAGWGRIVMDANKGVSHLARRDCRTLSLRPFQQLGGARGMPTPDNAKEQGRDHRCAQQSAENRESVDAGSAHDRPPLSNSPEAQPASNRIDAADAGATPV